MNRTIQSFVHRFFHDERGQMLPTMALMLTGLLGMSALAVDIGRAYASYRDLQASTNAAALAGAAGLPNTTAATYATTYSSLNGENNAYSFMPNVTMVSGYPKLACLTTLVNEGVACVAPANANAIIVEQQVVVPTFFAGLVSHKSITLTATATASMRGAVTSPYNVAILVDTTSSMSDTDNDSQCTSTRLACSLAGIQTLLKELSPCGASEATCGTATNGAVANSVDRVSLFTFPNVTVGTVSKDYDCTSSNPTTVDYSFPPAGATSYTPPSTPTTTPTYQVTPYVSDYRTSDTITTLSTASKIVLSVGAKSGCTGMGDPGGESTYYAGAIYAAQASLVAEQAANPGSQNVMILISDGDAEASTSDMASGYSSTSGVYPSTKQECHQAVTAAQAATAAGTRVYAVAYGAESSGCSTDKSPTITPCTTMQSIASSTQYFFSDYTQSGSSSTCVSASQPTSNLNQIFTDIGNDFTVPKLIPNGTT